MPWLQTGFLIAASTALDVAAALTGGGSLIGSILKHAMDRPLDKAAKDLLDRVPVVILDEGSRCCRCCVTETRPTFRRRRVLW